DQHQPPAADVLYAADVVPDTEVGDVVVEGVAGEIPPPGIFLDAAVDVVPEDAAFHVVGHVGVVVQRGGGPERRDLDDLAAETNVGEPEPPPDQAAVAEQRLDLIRMRVGGDV